MINPVSFALESATPGVDTGNMWSHRPGERVELYNGIVTPDTLALTIDAEYQPGSFTLRKGPHGQAFPDTVAGEWDTGEREALLAPLDAGGLIGILLVPTIVGPTIYGCPAASGLQGRREQPNKQFGAIFLGHDRADDRYLCNVVMPFPQAHTALRRLIIRCEQ